MTFSAEQLLAIAPMLVLWAAALAVLLVESFTGASTSRRHLMWMAIGACVIDLWVVALQWSALSGGAATRLAGFSGTVVLDRYALFADGLFLVATVLASMLFADHSSEHERERGDVYVLLLLAASGMMLLTAATDLVTVFLGIELMSLAVYALTGSARRVAPASARSAEAAMKYYLMGAFTTAILLYGIALLYGVSGSTNLAEIGQKIGQAPGGRLVATAGVVLLTVAFAFKVSAAPLHMWAPDAYEGAPTPITGFMATAVKAAAFLGAVRVFSLLTGDAGNTAGAALVGLRSVAGWKAGLGLLAAVTMLWGNLAALRQENLKRLLAYSSIGHAGYLLVGLLAVVQGQGELRAQAQAAVQFYLMSYTITSLGAFGVVAWLGRRGDERLHLDDWAGLAGRHPGMAFAMLLCLLSLGGVPPLAGFFGKFYLFRAAMEQPELLWLVILGVLMSVVSACYYLRVVMAMYFREPGRAIGPLPGSLVPAVAVVAAVTILVLGLAPSTLLELAAAAKAR
jgi:NADH-quinone oxidoreductase subunit N